MVVYKKGDLFKEPDLFAICHQANCFSRMKSGIAKTMVELHPSAEHVDKISKLKPEHKLGKFSLAYSKDLKGKELLVFNLYGQYNYGTEEIQTNYHSLESALMSMENYILHYVNYVKEEPIPNEIKVGIPYKIGCGLAGGDWVIVKGIIEKVFKDSEIIAVVLDNS